MNADGEGDLITKTRLPRKHSGKGGKHEKGFFLIGQFGRCFGTSQAVAKLGD